ncbi:MAG TPA: fumarylacetoacetate hydrolase family protein [Jatrophihabitantaceae bacterium]|nr:fumarylacetoacetate hydrolase family protein [Jatrophihabitantaceae bacterium]
MTTTKEGPHARWCRYNHDGIVSFGLVDGATVDEVDGDPFTGYTRTGVQRPLAELQLLTPCVPPTFYCAGLNYKAHIEWGERRRNARIPIPERPDISYRAQSALTPPNSPIVIPAASTGEVHYEGELVAVIGRTARHVSQAEALDYVLGYTIGNDVSERTWARQDRTLWRAKNSDTFKPMGPWIQSGLDPTNLDVTVKVNGSVVSEFNTSAMIFNVAEYISAISEYITLRPGDVIWTGTDGGTDRIAPGDVVEISVPGIGTLRNPVISEAVASQ